jgi:hypothetical protein
MLAATDQGESTGKHVRSEELHTALNNTWVRRDGRGILPCLLGSSADWKHGDGQKRWPRHMCDSALAQDIPPAKVCLDQWNLFDRESSFIVVVHRAAQCFETRDNIIPGILRKLFLGSIVRKNDKLYENITLVPKSKIAEGCFRISARSSLRNLQGTTNLVEFGRRTLGQLELKLDVLMRQGLHAP